MKYNIRGKAQRENLIIRSKLILVGKCSEFRDLLVDCNLRQYSRCLPFFAAPAGTALQSRKSCTFGFVNLQPTCCNINPGTLRISFVLIVVIRIKLMTWKDPETVLNISLLKIDATKSMENRCYGEFLPVINQVQECIVGCN